MTKPQTPGELFEFLLKKKLVRLAYNISLLPKGTDEPQKLLLSCIGKWWEDNATEQEVSSALDQSETAKNEAFYVYVAKLAGVPEEDIRTAVKSAFEGGK